MLWFGAVVVGQGCLRRKKCSQGLSRLVSEASECFTSSLSHYTCSKDYSVSLFNLLFPLSSLQINKKITIMKRQVQTSHEPSHAARFSKEHGWAQAKHRNPGLSLIPAPVEGPQWGVSWFSPTALFAAVWSQVTVLQRVRAALEHLKTTKPLTEYCRDCWCIQDQKTKNHKDSCSTRVYKFPPLRKSCSRQAQDFWIKLLVHVAGR